MSRLTALLVFLLAGVANANDIDLSPPSWPEGELERYENLFGAEKPLAESKTGIVVSTTAAAAARAGLEALNRGGSAVDAEGNVAALLHTINTALWGTTGIFVDGVAIADSAKYQQVKIARAGPGNRLPIETNPVLITRSGKPVLVSSSIGMGVHEQTYQAIVNILEYGLDPKAAAESPQVLRPMSGGLDRALGAEVENPAAQAVEEGAFDEGLLAKVREMRQPMQEITAETAGGWRGYWVGIHIDPETGIRRGAVSPYFDGWALGQDD